MDSLLPIAARAGALLRARGETISVAESSAGGLVSAALLAVPGASAYFLGGTVVYTRAAREALLAIPAATGPTGNRYGDAAGHACIAVSGPVSRTLTIETGHGDRVANMREFGAKLLGLLVECLEAAPQK